MKRILLVMSVAALMAAMVVATAMPALAASGGVPTGNAPIAGCPSGGGSNFVEEPNEAVDVISGAPSVSVNSDETLCSKTLTNFPRMRTSENSVFANFAEHLFQKLFGK